MTATDEVLLDGQPLSTWEVERVAMHAATVRLSADSRTRMQASRQRLASVLSDGEPYYGINTGFGALGRVRIEPESLRQLQVNLLRSHSTGVGEPLPVPTVRSMMLLLAASLARGHSGVRPLIAEHVVSLLNAQVTPRVPEIGSVGASGDLAPLAHMGLVLLGEGQAESRGQIVDGSVALVHAGLEPLQLEAKEGLAMINGTHLMAGRGALLIEAFQRLFEAALLAAAMSVDTCRATDSTLDPRVHALRCQTGQILVADRLRTMLADSQIIRSHIQGDPRVQDPYSFRCGPAVLGAAWDAFIYVRQCVQAELSAVTDNPVVLGNAEEGEIVSGGNFHGMPIALPLDVLAISLSHVAGISERRVYHMLSGADTEAELPTFLTPQAGLQSGLMIAQYTAAACCNELIGLANPASVANFSTCAGMEDYNSFGPRAAAKAVRALELTRAVVAIELLCAATGLDHHRPLRSGQAVEAGYAVIRKQVAPLTEDRSPAADIRAIETLIEGGAFAAEEAS